MFRHIGGISAPSFVSNPVAAPSSGETVFSSILNFMREKQVLDMARELLSESSDGFSCINDAAKKKQEALERHGMSKRVTSEDRQAFEVLYEDAVAGDPKSQLYLAHSFQYGEYGAVKNPKLAAKWCLKSACHNNADAQNLLGTFYVQGFGVEKDLRKAAAMFRSAAKLGSREAATNLKSITRLN